MVAPVQPLLHVIIADADLHFIISGDIITGDTEWIRYSQDSTFATYSQASAVVTGDSELNFGVGLSTLAPGTWYFAAVTQRGAEFSVPSPSESVEVAATISPTPPSLPQFGPGQRQMIYSPGDWYPIH